MTTTERDKAANVAVAAIEKEYGEGSIMRLGQSVGKIVPHVPTGIYQVDYNVMGIGGVPRKRITEIYGPESGGKTTLALQIVAQAQRAGGKGAYVDVENALDPNWMLKQGVDVDELLVSQPDYGEQALGITEHLIASNAFDVVVIDSVAALVPKAELDGEFGDSHMGLQARLMSQAMRKLNNIVANSNAAVIFINQIRDKIGVMFGSPETTTGGRALKFYASLRLDVRRISAVKEGDVVIGNKVKIKGAKNKMSAPFREAEVDLLFDRGLDSAGSLLDAAVEGKVVERSGSWFSYAGERLGQGRRNAADALTPALFDKITKELRAKETA